MHFGVRRHFGANGPSDDLHDADQVSAIFDWRCAMVGDGAYEAARLIFWSPWDIKVDKQLIVDFAEQTYGAENLATHLCAYEAHVGICELQYQGFTGTIDMTPTANRLNELIDQNVERPHSAGNQPTREDNPESIGFAYGRRG
jgi:hypothetical protein